MTCAHVVNVALKKTAGVDTVEVSLNKGLATVKLKPGNTVSVPQLWELIHQKGYTPKATDVTVKGELESVSGKLQLKVTGTKDVLPLSADAKAPAGFAEAKNRVGQTVTLQGVMLPDKNLKIVVPLQVGQVKK